MFADATGVILLQHARVSNQHVVRLKLMPRYMSITSPFLKKNKAGRLAGSVARASNSRSQGHEFQPHGHGASLQTDRQEEACEEYKCIGFLVFPMESCRNSLIFDFLEAGKFQPIV